MFNIVVSADGLAWETEHTMRMDRSRFHEYSGGEGDSISAKTPATLEALDGVVTLLMYETGSTGSQVNVVRVGTVHNVRAGIGQITFQFKETGRLPRTTVEANARQLGLADFEFSRTHWSIKDGAIPKAVRNLIEIAPARYDVALSFAGDDRKYVEAVAEYLVSKNVDVFYDKFEEAELWGKELTEHLDTVYRKGAEYCVIFISKHYASKMWPTHERRSALAAAVAARQEYILPARFDDTVLPGLRPTIGYISLVDRTPEDLGALIVKKLGR